jgi:predicted HTH transcriptional regulator
LENSLSPVPIELNDLDWKSSLSPKSVRLAQHISAFANLENGGFLVFGINNDSTFFSVTKEEADNIVHKLGNIAKNNLNVSIIIEHAIIEYHKHSLLFIYIPKQTEKPVYLKSSDIFNCFCRSAGQTMSSFI